MKISGFSLFVSITAAFGGILFGYHTAVISGALLFLQESFSLTTVQQQLVVSTLLIGALISAIFGGAFVDHFGRKITLFITLFFFLVGTFLLTTAESAMEILVGRFVTGIGIGLASLVVPLYISEMSPARYRGMLVSFNQFAITLGILLAYVVNDLFSSMQEWRGMFAIAFIPAFIQLFLLFFITDTPSWLISHGKTAKAYAILDRTKRDQKKEEIYEPKNISRKEGNYKALFDPRMRSSFFVGIGISVFQQITGINTVIYYSPKIFQIAGYETAQSAISATLSIGVINVLMTFAALWLVDKIGRRPLLIIGLLGMMASLALMGWSFFAQVEGIGFVAIGSLMTYVSFFAIGLGPITWLIISEIFPLKIRGKAMGIAVFANWFCNYLVSLTFLSLLEGIGASATFWLYTIICAAALWFVIKKVPETKGKTLEEVQRYFH